METQQAQHQAQARLHPLMAGAAVSVILVSLLGAAAFAGLLPNSRGTSAAPDNALASAETPAQKKSQDDKPDQSRTLTAGPGPVKKIIEHKATPHREYAQHRNNTSSDQYPRQAESSYAAAPAYREAAYREPAYREPAYQAPAYQAPAPAPVAQNSAIGIGVGALVGGLLGSQVGGGNGRTLAAIAGAVGGGYVGNEVAKNR